MSESLRALTLLYLSGISSWVLMWQLCPLTSVSWTVPQTGGCYHWSSFYPNWHWHIQVVNCLCWWLAAWFCGHSSQCQCLLWSTKMYVYIGTSWAWVLVPGRTGQGQGLRMRWGMVGAAVTVLSRFVLGNDIGTVFPLLDLGVSVTCALPSLAGAVGLWAGIVGWTGSSARVSAVIGKLIRMHHRDHLEAKVLAWLDWIRQAVHQQPLDAATPGLGPVLRPHCISGW